MARFNTSSLAFAIGAALVLLRCGRWAQSEVCSGAIPKLESACKEFVLKPGPQMDPSFRCCLFILGADIPCVCTNIPKIQKMSSAWRRLHTSVTSAGNLWRVDQNAEVRSPSFSFRSLFLFVVFTDLHIEVSVNYWFQIIRYPRHDPCKTSMLDSSRTTEEIKRMYQLLTK